jgi:predicted HD superfamily hydrolase involved in NAD metabolism
MNNEYVSTIKNGVEKILENDKRRFWHTIEVANTCACLAMRYCVDMEKAYVAGLLHDCAKCLSDEELTRECERAGIEISEYERKSPYLLHGKVGALYAMELFGVKDDEILSAITCHTTGKPAMTPLEEILFIADYIEPYRDKASDLDEIRSIVFTDIKLAICRVSGDTIKYLEKKGQMIDAATVETYNYYKYYADLCDSDDINTASSKPHSLMDAIDESRAAFLKYNGRFLTDEECCELTREARKAIHKEDEANKSKTNKA